MESTVLRKWVDDMGFFIKNIDSYHMISSGIEGHGSMWLNGKGYGGDEGNNFTVIHKSPYIDFCSGHLYPTTGWAALNITESQELIKEWIHDCQDNINKPFFLGEFNVDQTNYVGGNRSVWWTALYKTIEDYNAGGDAFWWFQYEKSYGGYGVNDGAPELKVFQQHSQNMQKKSGKYPKK